MDKICAIKLCFKNISVTIYSYPKTEFNNIFYKLVQRFNKKLTLIVYNLNHNK